MSVFDTFPELSDLFSYSNPSKDPVEHTFVQK